MPAHGDFQPHKGKTKKVITGTMVHGGKDATPVTVLMVCGPMNLPYKLLPKRLRPTVFSLTPEGQ